jgi:hypothetical protein
MHYGPRRECVDLVEPRSLSWSSLNIVRCSENNNVRAIAQAISRQFHTAAARVRARVRPCGICGEQSVTEADFQFLLSVIPLDCSTLFHHQGLVQ